MESCAIIDNVLTFVLLRSVIDLFWRNLLHPAKSRVSRWIGGSISAKVLSRYSPRRTTLSTSYCRNDCHVSKPAGNADRQDPQYHTVEAVFSFILANGVILWLLKEEISPLYLSVGLSRRNMPVIGADILALNGITHGIDRVLMIRREVSNY
jgi:hypothetical protein